MHVAIIAVTHRGADIALALSQRLPIDSTVYVKKGRANTGDIKEFISMKSLLEDIFLHYDGLIFIMAVGIVVRVIAPYIKDKRFDPAVVVMDDAGKHVISLLSGHIGGANELTNQVANLMGAYPVITTATDVANKPAPDVLAAKLGLAIEPFDRLKTINAVIANGGNASFYLDYSNKNCEQYTKAASNLGIVLNNIRCITRDTYDAAVLITPDTLPLLKPHVYLREPNLALGIGCRRNTPAHLISAAVENACEKIGRSVSSIKYIASSVIKSNEQGLLQVANLWGVNLIFYTNENLQRCIEKYHLQRSAFVEQQIGVGNVCEAAALLASKNGILLLTKTKYPQVTIAIAKVN